MNSRIILYTNAKEQHLISTLSLLYLNVQFVNENENKGFIWNIVSGISRFKMCTAAPSPKKLLLNSQRIGTLQKIRTAE